MTRSYIPTTSQVKRHVHIGTDKNKLRIQFSRSLSQELFGQTQKYLYLNLTDTPENRIEAESIALQIEHDIRAKKLEKNLKSYLPVNQLKKSVGLFYDPYKIDISLIGLFDKYCEFVRPQLQETTYVWVYQRQYKRILEKVPQNLNLQDKLVDELFNVCTGIMFLELTSLITRMIDWGKKREIISSKANNNILNIRADYKPVINRYQPGVIVTNSINYIHDKDYRAFTREEGQIIIQAFEDYCNETYVERSSTKPYKLPKNIIESRCTTRDFIKLKFWTGCRSGEASGLRWLDVDKDFKFIIFRNLYSSNIKKLKGLKTEHVGEEGQDSRKFPCGEKLSLLLEDLYRRNYQGNPEDFLFVTSTGNPYNNPILNYKWYGDSNISKKGIRKGDFNKLGIVTKLLIEGKISQYLSPYATRHTWITLQLLDGVHISNIAKLAGNSPKTILEHYSSYVPNSYLASEI